MSTVNQIIGGTFNDTLGNPLSNGYLLFRLNQDAVANSNTQVCSSTFVKIPLDSNGNVITSTVYSLWTNDVLTPSGTFYKVEAYTSGGQLVWGPNSQSVLSTPSPFNLDAWIAGKV